MFFPFSHYSINLHHMCSIELCRYVPRLIFLTLNYVCSFELFPSFFTWYFFLILCIPLNYPLLFLTKVVLFTVLDKVQNYVSAVLLHLNYVVSSFAFSLSSIPLGSCLLPIELYKWEIKLRNPVVSHCFLSVKLLSKVTQFRIIM